LLSFGIANLLGEIEDGAGGRGRDKNRAVFVGKDQILTSDGPGIDLSGI